MPRKKPTQSRKPAQSEPSATEKKHAARIARLLAKAYPDAACELDFRNAYELLVATILAAQCTDARVNTVTPALFETYPNPAAMAEASPEELEPIVKSTGFFRQKARSLSNCMGEIVERFAGEVPSSMEDLVSLPGVGRKTANVLLGSCFDTPAIVVDTHMKRLCNRLGLSQESNPEKIETELAALLPPKQRTGFSLCIPLHGRRVCKARKPLCSECVLCEDCPAGVCAIVS